MAWLLLALPALAAAQNMNGLYLIGNPNGVPDPHSPSTFNTDYAAKGHEFFDLYSAPITTRYGQVYWTNMPPVDLPPHILARFANKTIAITGYEADQVTADGQTVSVTRHYNHHYTGWLQGKHASMKLVPAHPHEHEYWMRGDGWKWMSVPHADAPVTDIPLSHIFAEGNGGEWRKSFHGYPSGMAQLVYNPVNFVFSPMQIDTWNRDNNSSKFVPGPLPKSATAPKDATYSGLLECPCSDRIWKQINHSFTTRLVTACGSGEQVYNASDCWAAALTLSPAKPAKLVMVDDASFPGGCSFVTDAQVQSATVYFNTADKPAPQCGKATQAYGTLTDAETSVSVSVSLDSGAGTARLTLAGPANAWFGAAFGGNSMSVQPYAIIVTGDAQSSQVSERKLGDHDEGKQIVDSLTLESSKVVGNVRTVILLRKLQGATPDHFTFDVTADSTVPMIFALGASLEFAYHKTHGGGALSIVNHAVGDQTTCVCDAGISGAICGNAIGGCVTFDKTGGQGIVGPRCPPQPRSDLAEQKNPTCTIQQYVGGLSCCKHLNVLLDKDQNPWPDQLLTFRLKFRMWFEDYKPATQLAPASHEDMIRFYWQTESYAGEYDVPKGVLGAPGMSLDRDGRTIVHTITSEFRVDEMVWGCNPATDKDQCHGGASGMQLVFAGGHCHAPACLSIELYIKDTNELLCRQHPVYGKGSGEPFDEEGYVTLPPCLWGDAKEGLAPRKTLSWDTKLLSIKRNNATFYHYGEMASWQMRGILVK